jgi:hypothetical protein
VITCGQAFYQLVLCHLLWRVCGTKGGIAAHQPTACTTTQSLCYSQVLTRLSATDDDCAAVQWFELFLWNDSREHTKARSWEACRFPVRTDQPCPAAEHDSKSVLVPSSRQLKTVRELLPSSRGLLAEQLCLWRLGAHIL